MPNDQSSDVFEKDGIFDNPKDFDFTKTKSNQIVEIQNDDKIDFDQDQFGAFGEKTSDNKEDKNSHLNNFKPDEIFGDIEGENILSGKRSTSKKKDREIEFDNNFANFDVNPSKSQQKKDDFDFGTDAFEGDWEMNKIANNDAQDVDDIFGNNKPKDVFNTEGDTTGNDFNFEMSENEMNNISGNSHLEKEKDKSMSQNLDKADIEDFKEDVFAAEMQPRKISTHIEGFENSNDPNLAFDEPFRNSRQLEEREIVFEPNTPVNKVQRFEHDDVFGNNESEK